MFVIISKTHLGRRWRRCLPRVIFVKKTIPGRNMCFYVFGIQIGDLGSIFHVFNVFTYIMYYYNEILSTKLIMSAVVLKMT